VVDAARQKPQTVTKHGKRTVVVVAAEEYDRLKKLERQKRSASMSICSPCQEMADFRAHKDSPSRDGFLNVLARYQCPVGATQTRAIQAWRIGRTVPGSDLYLTLYFRKSNAALNASERSIRRLPKNLPNGWNSRCALSTTASALSVNIARPGAAGRQDGNSELDLAIAATAWNNGLTVVTATPNISNRRVSAARSVSCQGDSPVTHPPLWKASIPCKKAQAPDIEAVLNITRRTQAVLRAEDPFRDDCVVEALYAVMPDGDLIAASPANGARAASARCRLDQA